MAEKANGTYEHLPATDFRHNPSNPKVPKYKAYGPFRWARIGGPDGAEVSRRRSLNLRVIAPTVRETGLVLAIAQLMWGAMGGLHYYRGRMHDYA